MMRFLGALVLLFGQSALAFPEMVRHGYVQCTACHVSPAGGGVLTPYGRELSAELLSRWTSPGEEQFLHSKIGKTLSDQGVLFGGDVRGIATHSRDSNDVIEDKNFLMMADLQSAYKTDKFTAVISIGEINRPGSGVLYGDEYATEYYGLLKFTDEVGLRAGRFLPAFGINFADHTVAVKEMLASVLPKVSFDSVELSYLDDKWTVLASFGRTIPQTRLPWQETTRALNLSYAVTDSARVGLSYWDGQGPWFDRRIFYGANTIFGFSHSLYTLTEIDLKFQEGKKGLAATSQWGYELLRGLTPYVQFQRSLPDTNEPTLGTDIYGVGFHFYPRPHFEISAEWDREHVVDVWQDMAYALAHYYF